MSGTETIPGWVVALLERLERIEARFPEAVGAAAEPDPLVATPPPSTFYLDITERALEAMPEGDITVEQGCAVLGTQLHLVAGELEDNPHRALVAAIAGEFEAAAGVGIGAELGDEWDFHGAIAAVLVDLRKEDTEPDEHAGVTWPEFLDSLATGITLLGYDAKRQGYYIGGIMLLKVATVCTVLSKTYGEVQGAGEATPPDLPATGTGPWSGPGGE